MTTILNERVISHLRICLFAIFGTALGLTVPNASAEGVFQMGLTQTMEDIIPGTTSRYIRVDILNGGEVINLNACGNADTDDIRFTVYNSNFIQQAQTTRTEGTVTCAAPMTAAPANSYQYTPPAPGTYYVAIDNRTGNSLRRYDVTVTPTAGTAVDFTGASGIRGRVSATTWGFNTGDYIESLSTDADYYILTPGGFPNTNFVWQLDLNNFAGFQYDLTANNRGVDAPNSGFSVPRGTNSVTPDFPLYINYPAIATPPPTQPATVTNFRFEDNAGFNNTISPGGTIGVQDNGFFRFSTNATTATYSIYIDVDDDGVFGNANDVQLNGEALFGDNSIFFDGNDNNGNPLPVGLYQAQAQVRLGEFHFIANDAETSGGGASAVGNGNGLTVYNAQPNGSALSTLVYWDDVTILGAGAGGDSSVPSGALSGSAAGYHTWGNFTNTSFGNERYIDTYVYGDTTFASYEVAVINDDNYTSGIVDITDTSTPGQSLTVSVDDPDLGQNNAAIETVTVTVTNDVTGEIETITLTETTVDSSFFSAPLPTTFGTGAGPNNNGTMTTQSGDTVTVTYNDPNNAFGNPEIRTDTGNVTGGADAILAITPNSVPGDILSLSVNDPDLVGDGTLMVLVVNDVTGESESITLTENPTGPGIFEGTLPTQFATTAGGDNNGTLGSQSGDTLTLQYTDALTAAGGTANLTAVDTVGGGATGAVTITPNSNPGDALAITVTDADLAGDGTLIVNAVNSVTGESEAITLTENGATPGLFEGSVATIFGAAAGTDDDGTFNTQTGDTVVVTYNDGLTATGASAAPTAADTVGGGAAGTVTITPNSTPGGALAITVTDADLAGDGTVVVTAVNSVTGESEAITLTENGATPGLFEGSVATIFGTAAGTDDDGTFNTQSGDTVIVTYNDAFTDTGATAAPTATDAVGGGVNGAVTITPNSTPGDALSITVTDADLAGDGTIIVTAVNSTTGESEAITLTENGATPGLFEGTVSTIFGASAGTDDDGIFNTQNGDTVTVTYNDALTTTGGTASPTASDAVGGGATGAVTITPNSTPGDALAITVMDTDLAGDGTLIVTAVNSVTGESEAITLTENGGTPGLFEGSVTTAFGAAAGANNDGSFNTQSGDTVVVTYNDAQTAAGGTASPTATDTVGGGATGTVTITPNSTPGESLTITVTDTDLAANGTLIVTAVNPATGESESLTLTENGVMPGLFEGTVATVFGTAAGTDDDGTFNTQSGNTVIVTYDDALTATGASASPTATDNVGGGATGAVTITPISNPGDTLALSVTDADLAGNGTLDVAAVNSVTGETETITLTESGATPGLFEGTIATIFGTSAGTDEDGTFNTQTGDTVIVTYDDALTATGASASPTATNSVGGGGTGTVTITPNSVPGDTLAIAVSDTDLSGDGTLIVTAVNPATGESEAVTLTENGATAGLFEGTVSTVFGTSAGTDDDGTFNTQSSDTIIVTYNDALTNSGGSASPTATDTVGGGVSGAVTITPNSVPGDVLAITVTDGDLSGDGTLIVTATNPSTGESESLTLTENGVTPGLFEGTVSTVFGTSAGANDDGTFNTQSGNTIVVTYSDALTTSGGTASPTATDTVSGGATGTVAIPPNSTPGDTLVISVTDADLVGDGTLSVTAVNPSTGESEALTLTESGATPGLFEGSIATVFGANAGIDNDGTFNTETGNTIVVTYDDTLTNTGGAASPTDTNSVGGGVTGSVTITPNSTPGDVLAISVTDADLAGDGTLVVTAVNPATGESEAVTLTENGATPGLFEGNVATIFGASAGANNDGTFNTQGGNTVVVTYNDALTNTGGTASPTATDTVGGGATGTVTITQISNPGDALAISVTDADLAGNGTLLVTTVNSVTGESETITLTESGATPGLFEGTIATVFGAIAGTDNDGTFNTQSADTLIVTYQDAVTASGGTAAPTATNTVGGGGTGTVTITPNSISGDTLSIAVSDTDLSGDGTLIVTAVNPVTGESEAVTLTENGATAGLFEGTIATLFGTTAGTDNDGTFNTQAGDSVTVTYNDSLTASGATASPSATDIVGGGVTGIVTITPNSAPGDVLAISVTDGDLSADGTLIVATTNTVTGETETVTLVESGATPGLFEGTIATVFGTSAGANDNGSFNTQTGDTIVVTYSDALTATGGSAAPTATDTVGGGVTGTITITPNSTPGDTLAISVSDTDISGNGTLIVNAVNSVTGESEDITLIENGVTPGLFEGTVATTFGTVVGTNNDAEFNTQSGNAIIVTYDDALTSTGGAASATATDTVGGGATGTVSITPLSNPGDVVSISVTDADLAGDGTLVVTTINSVTGESEAVTLSESGATPGLFEGTVSTVFGTTAGTDNDGTFNSQTADTLVVTYNDALTAAGDTASSNAANTVGGGGTGTVTITPNSIPGDTLSLAVSDTDLSGDGTLIVTAINTATGESEAITLTENGATPGLFEGTVDTVFATTAGTNNDGSFNTQNADTITVTYQDALTTSGGAASPTASDIVGGGATGTLTITPNAVPGDALSLSVSDTDLTGNGTLNVVLTHDDTGETETVTLTETSPGVFTASVPTVFGTTAGTNNDGTFTVQNGDTITAEYVDALTTQGSTATPQDQTAIGGGVDGTVTITPASIPGETLQISVTDADLSGAGAQTVSVRNTDTGEVETITLTENGVMPGLFEGSIATTFGTSAGPINDATLATQNGDTLIVSYEDALTSTGAMIERTDTSTVNGGVTGTIDMTPSVAPGDDLTITVTDGDLNANAGSAETVTVSLINDDTGEIEAVTLTETGVNTGVFTALLPTQFGAGAGPDNNGTLDTQAGQSLTVTYADALTTNGGAGSVNDNSNVTGGGASFVSITPASIPGDALSLSVTDADVNANPALADTVIVTVTNSNNGDIETVTLTETGANTGVFTADLATSYGSVAGANNNGTLTTQPSDLVTLTYADALTASGGTEILSDDSHVLGITLSKAATVNLGADGVANAGDTISYVFAIENISDIALNTLTITDPTASVTGGPIPLLISGGQNSSTFQASYTLRQADIDAGSVTNVATLSSFGPGGVEVTAVSDDPSNTANIDADGDGNPSDPTITNFAPVGSLAITKSGTLDTGADGVLSNGDIINYAFAVTNTGNVTLNTISVTDPLATMSGSPIATLAPGQTNTSAFTAHYAVTQADIDAGGVTNIATATGQTPSGAVVTGVSDDPSITSDVDADGDGNPSDPTFTRLDGNVAMLLLKTATLDDGGDGQADAGDSIDYVFSVTNTGSKSLTVVTIDDPLVVVSGGPLNALPAGQTDASTFSARYTLTQADIDAGGVTNSAIANATGPSGNPVSAPSDDPNNPVDIDPDGDGNPSDPTVTAVSGAPSVAVTKTASLDLGADGVLNAGDRLIYAFVVRNTGNVTLTNLRVTDAKAAMSGSPIASLAPGASNATAYAASYTITQADINAGSVTNSAIVSAASPNGSVVTGVSDDPANTTDADPDGDGNPSDPTVTPLDAIASLSLTKTASLNLGPDNIASVGDIISYSFVLKNTGNVSLTGVIVTDPMAVMSGGEINGLVPGHVNSNRFTAIYALTQADIDAGQVVNSATITGQSAGGLTATAISDDPADTTDADPDGDGNPSDPTITTLALNSSLALTKTATLDLGPDNSVSVGDAIDYSFALTNMGNVTISNISINDPLTPVNGGPVASLAPGATDATTFTARYVLTQADLDAGKITNSATATGALPSGDPIMAVSDDPSNASNIDPDGDGNPSDPTVTQVGGQAAMLLTKSANLNDGGDGRADAGDTIDYVFSVTNTGTKNLTIVSIDDAMVTVSGGPLAALAPGATDAATFTATYTLTQADIDAGAVTNSATANATGPDGSPVTATSDDPSNTANIDPDGDGNPSDPTITATPSAPAITLTKSADLDVGADGIVSVGDAITYTFTVGNLGNVTLNTVTINDPIVPVSGGPIAALAPGASDATTFAATYAITQADIDAGKVSNSATVNATTPNGTVLTAVSDDPVETADIDADGDGHPSDPTITTLDASAGLSLSKTATVNLGSDNTISAGDTISYAFSVTNTGNVTLSGVIVTDPLVAIIGSAIPSLAPGQTVSNRFTANYEVTQADIDSGSITNSATATGLSAGGLTATAISDDPADTTNADADGDGNPSDPTITTLSPARGLALIKTAILDLGADNTLSAGDAIDYSFAVTNTGNLTVTDITLNDPIVAVIGGPIAALAPGATDASTFTARYVLTQADLDAGHVSNSATANGELPNGDPIAAVSDDPSDTANIDPDGDGNPSDPTVTKIGGAAAMLLTKTATLNDGGDGRADAGDTIDYVFSVTNTGTKSLTIVTIDDPMVTVSGGPLNALPAGTTDATTFSARYTLTQSDLDAGGVTNSATATATGPDGNPVTAISDDPTNPTNIDPDGDGNPSDPTITTTTAEPSLALTKSAALDMGADGITSVGDTITYTFTLSNPGNVTLNNVTLSDPIVRAIGGPISSLAPGASDATTFSAVYTITQADINAGGVTNSAIARAATPNGTPVTAVSDNPADPTNTDEDGDGNPSDPTVTTLDAMPALSLTKTATLNDGGDGFADVGDTIAYAFALKNIGNVTLTGVIVTDALVTVQGGEINGLVPQHTNSNRFTATYVLTQADIDAGRVTNSALITGQTAGGITITAVSDDPTNTADIDADGDGQPSDPTVTELTTNLPVVAANDSSSTQTATSVAIPVLVNDSDPEGGALRITAVTQGGNGTVTFQPNGTVIYTPAPNFTGVDTFTYTVCDPVNRCDDATVTVTIDDDSPAANADTSVTAPDTPVNIAVLINDTDPNGDDLTVTTTTAPGNGVVFINPDNSVTYTPAPGFVGSDDFTYTICDDLGYCDVASVNITVSADRPSAVNDIAATPSGTPAILTLTGNDTDPNGDVLTVTAITQPASGTAVLNPNGTVTYTPTPGFIGNDIFTYTICDPANNCDTATVSIDVTNQLPVAVADAASTGEGTAVIIDVTVNDSDAEGPLTLTSVSPPASGTVVINPDDTLTYTPNDGFIGTDSFTYTVCDSANACVDAVATVTVTEENPELTPDTATTEPAVPVTVAVLVNDTDPNGDTLTVTEVTQPAGGAVTINPDGTITVLPDADFEGVLVTTYTACDSDNNCETTDLTVTVDAVSPRALDDSAVIPGDLPYTFDPRVNDTDPDGDALTVASVTQPATGGAVIITPDGTLTFTPTTGYSGPVTFTYDVCDADNNCDTATVTLTVEPPVAGINGIVFLDLNGDDDRDPGEPLQLGYVVEALNPAGTVIGTATTDVDGFYEILGLPTGLTTIQFREPGTNVVYGVIGPIDLTGGVTTIDQNFPIDPSGVVYDAQTRAPVPGVLLTLVDIAAQPLPDVCFVSNSQQNQLTSTDGYYRFDIVPGADAACPVGETDYRIIFDAPGTYNDTPSTLITANNTPLNPAAGTGPLRVQPQITAPTLAQNTDYFLGFILASGDRDVVNNHIPLDPATILQTPLVVTKVTPRRDVSFGDLVPYSITVRNTDAAARTNLDIVDIAPPGFRYVADSARLNGVAVPNVITRDRQIIIPGQNLAADSSLTVDLIMAVGARVTEGRYINQALVRSALNGAALSDVAQAEVRVVPEPLFDCSEVIGKVFDDKNQNGYQDEGEDGMAGVRLVTVKGLIVTTDQHGRYHIACAAVPNAQIGSNFILKMDTRSLPTGYRVTTENPRVIRLTRGKMSKANFGTSIRRVVTLDLSDRVFEPGTTRMNAGMIHNIGQLITVLRAEESVLRLNYHAYEGGGLAEKRNAAVSRHIRDLWDTDGCCYTLIIEQKTLLPNVGPRAENDNQRGGTLRGAMPLPYTGTGE